MLKLIKGVVPTGTINWENKVFTVDVIIWAIQTVYIDGVASEATFDKNTIEVESAPSSFISLDLFQRDVEAVEWDGMTTLWGLKIGFYRRAGRLNEDFSVPTNMNRIYPEAFVKEELRKSLKRITNRSPEKERIQQYTTMAINSFTVSGKSGDDTIEFADSLNSPIIGMFMLGNGVTYDYYNLIDNTFQVKDADVAQVGDKVVIGSKIPSGVQKVSAVYINGSELDYEDERTWSSASKKYTIIKDWQGNRYIFSPYSEDVDIMVVKYIPDHTFISDDNDVVDIPEEYSDVVVYDTLWRLLRDKEDDRWASFKDDLWNGKQQGLLYEYQSFIKSSVEKTSLRIGLAKTYN